MSAAIAMRATWIDAISRQHVLEVAHGLGLVVLKSSSASGGSFACPACNAERRHQSRHDRRLACGVRPDGTGWRCFECEVSGDQLHLVALALTGRKFNELGADDKQRVRTWVEEWTNEGTARELATERPRLDLTIGDAAPQYPPPGDVLALLQRCRVVTADKRISTWLSDERGLDARAVAGRGLAAALSWGTECPAWARTGNAETEGKPWSQTGYRLLVPMLDASGRLRNVLARFVGTPKSERAPKSRAAKGYQRRALVLADDPGRQLLAGALDTRGRALRVVVAEGEMDLLTFASAPEPEGTCRAVIGIVNGSWSDDVAARIPDGATVVVATHHDSDGEKYRKAIVRSLEPRLASGAVRAERWAP